MKYVAGAGVTSCDLLYSGISALPKEGEEVYSSGFEMKLGGGATAVMIHLARLGIPTFLATYLGKDIFSGFAKKEIEKEGIQYQNLFSGKGIPVNITSAMITPGDRTFVSYRKEFCMPDALKDTLRQEMKRAVIIRMNPDLYTMYKEIKMENPNVILVMDTGWNDGMSLEMYSKYLQLADYFTPNCKEAMKITGKDTPQEAAEVLSQYFEKTIIKLGEQGCLLRENGINEIIPPLPRIHAVDATGAGDAFISGFLYGLYYNYPIRECIIFGNVIGGKCVEKVGCLSNTPTEKELLELAQSIRAANVPLPMMMERTAVKSPPF
ncbi:carbohydrate kinase family protein [Mediterraneibacter sp. NSJ-55]|uniref:Carbohydrate kinase family protein n=1 Tax=Mediterraneibacter hominis TaxID=2763054 RepID=A0A923RQ21_9FIRM|nr:carbohydrate kinase family protein [Mediterraneibacter hominis]MBC5689114.1 carbohydrate kinase family protein [Mediterraneibacter hominis]